MVHWKNNLSSRNRLLLNRGIKKGTREKTLSFHKFVTINNQSFVPEFHGSYQSLPEEEASDKTCLPNDNSITRP